MSKIKNKIPDIILIILICESLYHNKDFGGIPVVLFFLLYSIIFDVIYTLMEKAIKERLLEKDQSSNLNNVTAKIISIATAGLLGLTVFHITCTALVDGYKNSFTHPKFLILLLSAVVLLALCELGFFIYYRYQKNK